MPKPVINRNTTEIRAGVMQISYRRDYAVARAFHAVGALAVLATDLVFPQWLTKTLLPRLSRYSPFFGATPIVSAPWVGLFYRKALTKAQPGDVEHDIRVARDTVRRVIPQMEKARPNLIFGLDAAAVELFEHFNTLKPRPFLVLEQCVAPRSAQDSMLGRLEDYIDADILRARQAGVRRLRKRELREWELADCIVAPSRYVYDALVADGCAAKKIVIVPYGYSPKQTHVPRADIGAGSSLKGLYVGAIDYRKGIQDIAAIMPRLSGRISLDAYGTLLADSAHIEAWSEHINFHGPQPFETVVAAYKQADFFILPSHLEGSAMVVYEALAYGLPIVTTAETGSVVEDGKDGLVVPAGDTAALEAALLSLLKHPARLKAMSVEALVKAQSVTAETYDARLLEAIRPRFEQYQSDQITCEGGMS